MDPYLFFFVVNFWRRQLAAGLSLNCASCRGNWGECSFPRSATAIHSVAVDRTPNLPTGRRTLYHWAIATPYLLDMQPTRTYWTCSLSIPIGHAVKLKEERDTIKMVLQMLFICSTHFFWKTKSSNYQDLVNELLASYHMLGCNKSIKLHYLKS